MNKFYKSTLLAFIIYVLVFCNSLPSFAKLEKTKLEKSIQLKTKIIENEIKLDDDQPTEIQDVKSKDSKWAKRYKFIKGEKGEDGLLLGMYSWHTKPGNHMNATNNQIGVDYNGFSAARFVNSFNKESYYVGVVRKLGDKKFFNDNLDLSYGYKLGILHGYGDKYANFNGFSPAILPTIGVNFKYIGMDVLPVPGQYPTFIVGFRFNNMDKLLGLDKKLNQNKNKRIVKQAVEEKS